MRHIPYFDSLAQGLRENLLALIKVNGKKVDLTPDGGLDLEIKNIDIDTLENIKNSCNNSADNAFSSEKKARIWAEGHDDEVSMLKGKHSSKVSSAIASAYAEAPFGENVGDHVSADGAIINADVTKTSVDTAIGVSAAGSENKVYAQNGDWVNLPIGDSNGANTDLSNLSPVGQGVLERKADLIKGKIPEYQLPDSFIKQKMGYEIYAFNSEVRAGVIYSIMQMDEVRINADVFANKGNTIGFTFTGDEGPGFGANVFFPYPQLENMEALRGHIRPVEGGVSVDMGNAGLDRLIVTTDSQLHPVVAEAVFNSGVLSKIHVRTNITIQPGYEYYTDAAVELKLPSVGEEDSEGEYYVYSGDGSKVWLDSGYNLDGDFARIAGDALHTNTDGRKYLSMGTGSLVHARLRQYQNDNTGLPELKLVDLGNANRFGDYAPKEALEDKATKMKKVHLHEPRITAFDTALVVEPNTEYVLSYSNTVSSGVRIEYIYCDVSKLTDGDVVSFKMMTYPELQEGMFKLEIGLNRVVFVNGFESEPGGQFVHEYIGEEWNRGITLINGRTMSVTLMAESSPAGGKTALNIIDVGYSWNYLDGMSSSIANLNKDKADASVLKALSDKVNDNQAATDVVLSGLLTDKADKAVKPAELTGTSVTVRPSGYYTWNAAGACTIEFTGWDAEKLQTSELHVSTAVGATLGFPAGTVIKGDTITGGLPYDISISHDAEGYVAVIMERV